MSHVAYIGVGSNLGDRRKNCLDAIRSIEASGDIFVVKVSGWFDTPPEDISIGQSNFINGVVKVKTSLSPRSLLTRLMDVEELMGRPRVREKGMPRTIDLDILIYDDIILEEEDLKIPHPLLHKRLFVLRPLCDIDPSLVHPVLGVSVEELLRRLVG